LSIFFKLLGRHTLLPKVHSILYIHQPQTYSLYNHKSIHLFHINHFSPKLNSTKMKREGKQHGMVRTCQILPNVARRSALATASIRSPSQRISPKAITRTVIWINPIQSSLGCPRPGHWAIFQVALWMMMKGEMKVLTMLILM